MSITKTFIDFAVEPGAAATLSPPDFDSTSYTHLIAVTKWETDNTLGATMSDNKGSGTWNKLTLQTGAFGWIQMHWVEIGTPGTSTTVTMTTDPDANFRFVTVWGVNATSGQIALVDESFDAGSGTTYDPGTLSNPGGPSVVGFYGVTDFNGVSYTAPAGWTEDGDYFGTFGVSGAVGSLAPSTSTSIATSGAISGSADWAAVAAIFKEDSGGAATLMGQQSL